jgi:hypothetical protein
MTRKHRSSLKPEIRRVSLALREHWDPIGLGGVPELPVDEYDSYAPRVLRLLQMEVDDSVIAEHLASLEAREMGLQPRSLAELTQVAALIRSAIGPAFQRGA